jgi:hypothetical protein
VKMHLHNIYVKFAIRNRTTLALLALNLGVAAPIIESSASLEGYVVAPRPDTVASFCELR